ncbi:MAG: HipA domain-containing protein [Pseudomonadota bacterium]
MSFCYKCRKKISGENHYGLHPNCFGEWFQCPPDATFSEVSRIKVTTAQKSVLTDSFLAGKFRKYTAVLDGKKYIWKVVEDVYPNLPRVEFVSNQIASLLGLNIPVFFFLDVEGKDCFVTKNFLDETRWQKLTHIYHYISGEDEFNVDKLSKVIFEITKKPQDVKMFYQMLLFDALIGNNDRHGRNFGILSVGKKNRLAPIYDNSSNIGIEDMLGADLSPRGAIRTSSTDEPTMKDYVIELKQHDDEAMSALNTFKKKCNIEEIKNLIKKSFLDKKVKEAMMRLITKRHGEFCEYF